MLIFMEIILASESQARQKAMRILGLDYKTVPSKIDENSIRDDNPHEMARKLAEAKARAVAEKHTNNIIIAADLFVVMNHKIYEKPKSEQEAFDMLKSFSGKESEIIAGLAVLNSKTKKMLSTSSTCNVKFRELLDEEIKEYISRYPVLKFAGAYDGDGLARFAASIHGSYNFLTGLSMNELILFLREQGVKV